MWVATSSTPKDFYDHLPTVKEWLIKAPTAQDLAYRAALWADAAGILVRHEDFTEPQGPRVGYNLQADEPFFIVKGNKGLVTVACRAPMQFD